MTDKPSSEIVADLKAILDELDPREAEVLKIRLGLDRGEPRTLVEVGEHFGLAPERIAVIERQAMAKLRKPPPRLTVIRGGTP
jgi:RNA polymerase sigma factor (sigma-70 family)